MDISTILIVDDDPEILTILQEYLEEHNLRVLTADCGKAMFDVLQQEPVDLIILDVMLPDTDGLTLCQKLRDFFDKPILMLSAAAAEQDRILGIELGADDYLPKPFSLKELHVRILALLRRDKGHLHSQKIAGANMLIYEFGPWQLNATKRILYKDKAIVKLSPVEYDLLHVFVRHPNKDLSREQLSELSQRSDDSSLIRTIDSQIRRLRNKLEVNSKRPEYIKTVRNFGYRFDAEISEKNIPVIMDD